MYNTNLKYQNVSQEYNVSMSLYKSIDNLVGNYSTKSEHKSSGVLSEFSTHEPFTCGCDYNNH